MGSMTYIQKIALTIAVLSFLAAAGTQLTDILAPLGSIAPIVVKEIVSLSGFVSGILGVVLSFATGQASQVKTVQAMPGISGITVNASASPELAQLAVDPTQNKIDIQPGAEQIVAATAKAST